MGPSSAQSILKTPGAVAVARERAPEGAGQAVSRKRRELSWGHVAENEWRVREGGNGDAGTDHAAERFEVAGQRSGELLRAAPGKRPATGVRGHPHDQADGGAGGGIEGHDGMRRQAREEGSGARAAETRFGKAARRTDGVEAEAGEAQRVTRDADGCEDVVAELVPGSGERFEEGAPGLAVGPETGGGGVEGALEQNGGAVVQGMGEGRIRVDPFQTEAGQGKQLKTGRADGQGVDGGADVVNEAGQGKLGGAEAASELRGLLQHLHGMAGAGQQDGRAQAVGA